MKKKILIVVAALIVLGIAFWFFATRNQTAALPITATEGVKPEIPAPSKSLIPTMNIAPAVGWKDGEAPTAAAGLKVNAFGHGLQHPRWLLPLPNGDVLVAESDAPPKPEGNPGIRGWVQGKVMKRAGSNTPSANRITLLRDADGDGVAETRSVLIADLFSPFGMALVGDELYIANADALVKVPFKVGQTKIDAKPVKVIDLPGGPINHHWTKNVIASRDGKLLYITVGSNSNVGERGMAVEKDRAAVLEYDIATKERRVYAYGIRNPNGLAWQPGTDTLWTVANERDELGSDIVPDYLTSVQFGGFYGWPWYYWGGVADPRPTEPDTNDLAGYVIRPDYALGPHVAALGLTFSEGAKLGPKFASGAFIGEHGSWNRKPKSGYKVVFVPFVKGRPAAKPIDVLTGFLDEDEDARGRPVGVVIDRTGALLVADDVGGKVWRVAAAR
ncbi:sorbosone dehydrogenase family protein [Sphingomonas naphthae]|uniref:Sorbosone dehydrogenase family protein n=1 Tax=Sphingomonas naphthae TaxID=1813468 RepID=A0ABY7TH37_9SPHN|nr:sorbosone dehydrogenase family protein [Sphingomonas naphthae]WCT72547.1 sorbosone dehydrogenase family protein [Sphingomonas naphthae]